METIDAFIFVQAFVWGALLLKKRSSGIVWLGLSFLVLGVIYFLDYSQRVYGFQIPVPGIFSCILILFLLSGYYQYESLVLSDSRKPAILIGGIMLFLLMVLFQSLVINDNKEGTWLLAGIAGILSVLTDSLFLVRRIKEKTHTGSILHISNYRLHFHILALKTLYVVIILLEAGKVETIQSSSGFPDLLLQGVFAGLIFSTGYNAVQFSYVEKSTRKFSRKKKLVIDMGKNVTQLMEEKKPYLDCELTLGKVAAMLEMTEHGLTSLLHTDMQTSFYDLINGYRIETVKEKLLQPDSKKYTIMSAAYESGFNSRSTFYRIFKEHTGMQPGEFIERNN